MKVSELLEMLSELSPEAEVPLSITAMLSNEAEMKESLILFGYGEMKWDPGPYTPDGAPPMSMVKEFNPLSLKGTTID